MIINAAIQLLPLAGVEDKYGIIDKAIAIIKESGIKHQVCPFETAVEGEADEIYSLIRRIQDETLKNGCSELLLNVKIHAAAKNVALTDKIAKYS